MKNINQIKKNITLIWALLFAFTMQVFAQGNSVNVRNANYQDISLTSLPAVVTDSLTPNDDVLADIRQGSTFKMYRINVANETTLKIYMQYDGYFDTYLYLLNSDFEEMDSDDDTEQGSAIMYTLNRGTYYVIATTYDHYPVDEVKHFSLTISTIVARSYRTLTYQPLAFNTPTSDIHNTTDTILSDLQQGYYPKGYSFTLNNDAIVAIKIAPDQYDYHDVRIHLLNSDMEQIDDIYGDYPSQTGAYQLSAGNYFIVTAVRNFSSTITDTLSITKMQGGVAIRDLNYSNLVFGHETNDSLTTSSQILNERYVGYYAKGYTFTADADKIFYLTYTQYNNNQTLLLDSNFREINNTWGYTGERMPYNGRYYVVVTGQRVLQPVDYTYNATLRNGIHMRNLTFSPITLNNTIFDSLTDSDPILIDGIVGSYAKGYSFTAPANSIFSTTYDYNYTNEYSTAAQVLLDSNFNILSQTSGYGLSSTLLPYTGTYYLVAGSSTTSNYHVLDTTKYHIITKNETLKTYYIDPIDGDNGNNGLTPTTAFKTLAYAFSSSNHAGIYNIMNDYTITNVDEVYNGLIVDAGHILPYRDTIRISLSDNYTNSDLFRSNVGQATFGDMTGTKRFIFDGINNANSTLLYGFKTLSNITITNCSARYIISIMEDGASLTLNNTNISNNIANEIFSVYGTDITLNNTNITNNRLSNGNAIVSLSNSTAYLNSGNIANNRAIVPAGYEEIFAPVGLDSITLGGIMAGYNSAIHFGADFRMDTNNYIIMIDYDMEDYVPSTIVVDNDINATHAAKVIAVKVGGIDNEHSTIFLVHAYSDGKQILTGRAVANNYNKFLIAQIDTAHTWVLRNDGKIYGEGGTQSIDNVPVLIAQVYPNPTVNELFVKIEKSGIEQARILDMQGRVVTTIPVSNNTLTINLSSLSNGIYFLQMIEGNKVVGTSRFIKK